jgi:hypothetical protein
MVEKPIRPRAVNKTEAPESVRDFVPGRVLHDQTRARARACHGVLIDAYVAARVAEHHARVHLRQSNKAERSDRWQKILLERQQQAEERARRRELKNKPCGARTRAGHPCRAKGLGRGGRCRNHGGASTGPRTKAGRHRIAAAARRRWQTLRSELKTRPAVIVATTRRRSEEQA